MPLGDQTSGSATSLKFNICPPRMPRAGAAWALSPIRLASAAVPISMPLVDIDREPYYDGGIRDIAPLGRAFKQGWQPRWVAPTSRQGKGWHTQLQLPLGVTVEMINAKKPVLAHNLLRLPVEVWPTEPRDQPGVMDLWVADQGSLSGPVPPWPLLDGGKADYFATVPAGVSQRGEPVTARLMAANYMIGGIMGSGKSSLVIGLLLGALLDPLVEAEVYVMAYNGDYDPLEPRLNVLVKGDEFHVVRPRPNYDELIGLDSVPDWF
jgi:predicted acylesterase/phospholipase RssA